MKRRIICILAGVLLVGGLAGCSTDQPDDTPLTWIYTGDHEGIFQDNQTGVQYIFRYQGGICIRVNPDGTPYMGEE